MALEPKNDVLSELSDLDSRMEARPNLATQSVANVSVILAAYNSLWLEDAIRSVVCQTTDAWELIVLDDADSLEARAIVCGFDDERIRYLANTQSLGPALNHQRGIDESNYSLIAFINHDDVWDPTLLEKLTYPLAHNPTLTVCFSDHWVIGEDGSIDEEATEAFAAAFHRDSLAAGFHHGIEELAIVHKSIPVAQSAVIRKASVPKLPRWVGGAYDFYIAASLATAGSSAYFVNERLASFRLHGTNLGSRRSPLRDLASARIYAGIASSSSRQTSRFALRETAQALLRTPRSTVRWCMQSAARGPHR